MQGRCIQETNSSNLKKDEKYYIFPHGQSAYFVSRFPTEGSHFGAYQKHYFKVLEDQDTWPPEPNPSNLPTLHEGKVYKAELIWRKEAYANSVPLGTYFITTTNGCYKCSTDCNFYFDAALKRLKGRFPLHWFNGIQVYDENVVIELPQCEWQQMDLFSI